VRKDGLFIGIEVDDEIAANAEIAAKLAEVCPVDIYAQEDDGTLRIVEENIDECVLCRLCLDAAPDGTIHVLKRYDGDAEL
jgi:ferredoxin-like protein FixX